MQPNKQSLIQVYAMSPDYLTSSGLYLKTTRLLALFPGPPRSAGTRKVKPIWILLKQETVSGSGISWAIYKSAPRSKQITVPAPHHSVFSGWMPFLLSNQQHQSTEGYVLQKDDPNSSTKITSNHSHCQLLLQFSVLQVFRTGCWQHPYVSYLVPC